MIIPNLEKWTNKCSFARNYTCSTKRTKSEAAATTISLSQRTATAELPKELLSTVALTTHLLPTAAVATKGTHFSYRGQKDSARLNNSNGIPNHSGSSSNIFCGSNCSNACRTRDCNKRKMKRQRAHQQQQHTAVRVLTTTPRASKNINIHLHLNLPTFKFRHREYKKSKTNTINKTKTIAISNQNGLQKPLQHSVVAIPTKPFPLMPDTTSKLVKISRKPRKTKSISTGRNSSKTTRLRPLSDLKVTSLFSLLTLICLETVLLSTVSNCAKTFYMHWNTSNSIFRIDNTDHIIDVNKGNLAFEFDQVHIICPVYEPGTFENETEKYIIYNVSKVEYETCRITNADPRVIAICDKPQKLMFFTITFRPFTPQPGGLEFLPGNDYYFISTSSKDDLYRRIGGRCSTNNMKVVFKVCCDPEDKSNKTLAGGTSGAGGRSNIGNGGAGGGSSGILDYINNGANGSGAMNGASAGTLNQQHINSISTGLIHGGGININNGGGVQQKGTITGSGVVSVGIGTSGTSINTNIDQFNRIPTQTNGISSMSNGIGSIGLGSHGSNGVLLSPSGAHGVGDVFSGGGVSGIGGQYTGHQQTGIRINNVPSSQQHPSHKNNNADDHFNKHPNEVVKNEELTYNSAGTTLHHKCNWKITTSVYKAAYDSTIWISIRAALYNIDIFKNINFYKFTIIDNLLLKLHNLFSFIFNPIIILCVLLVTFSNNLFNLRIKRWSAKTSSSCKVSLRKSTKSSYLPIISSNCSPRSNVKSDVICAKEITKKSFAFFNNSLQSSNNAHILRNTYRNQR